MDRCVAVALARLGGDDDDASRTTGAIDSRRRRVLEDVDALNVLWRDSGKATLNAINKDERRVATAERDDTTETNC